MNGLAWIVIAAAFVGVGLAFLSVASLLEAASLRYRHHVDDHVGVDLRAQFVRLNSRELFTLALGSGVAVVALSAVLLPLPIAMALGLLGLAAPRIALAIIRQRRRQAFIQQLPDALQGLAASLRAGTNLGKGLELISRRQPAPLGEEFSLMLSRQRLGESLESILNDLQARFPSEEVALFRSAVLIAHQVGGDLAYTLDMLANTLRERAQVEDRIVALTAMGRMQGRVMTLLPVAIGAMLYVQQPKIMGRLFTEPLGWGVLALAAVMMGVAMVSIRRIVAIDV